jgi:hypothetical protein
MGSGKGGRNALIEQTEQRHIDPVNQRVNRLILSSILYESLFVLERIYTFLTNTRASPNAMLS